jgi:hypothetical protein
MLLGALGIVAVKNNLEETAKTAKRTLNAIARTAATVQRQDFRTIAEGAGQYSREIEAVMDDVQ